ncbi:MAG: DUF3341 domain-containing protein, partial [Planctomycetales bacterium]|nr:DUF3341 domain-containing protein [Planctomycetales bacterium]
LTVLFAAFTTVFAMLGLNGLPKFNNPLFTNPKFDRATDDRFFLWVDSRDKYFNSEKVKSLLAETGAVSVEEVREDDSPSEVPRGIIYAIVALILLTLVPGGLVLNMRNAKSGQPRFHVFFDMDFQPKRKAQTATAMFEDGRVQRLPVPGTVARGEAGLTDSYLFGYEPDVAASSGDGGSASRMVSYQQDASDAEPIQLSNEADGSPAEQPANATGGDESSDDAPSQADAVAAAAEPDYDWLTDFPLQVDEDLLNLGKRKFEQNCAVCHGFGGYGDGLVSQRAVNLAQGNWLEPTNLHSDIIQKQPVGRIYYTIANGKGKMAGYAASLTPKERWAVVLYVRALQRSQNAKESDVAAAQP